MPCKTCVKIASNPCLNRCSCYLVSQSLPCRNSGKIHSCWYSSAHKENTKCIRPGLRRINEMDDTSLLTQCDKILEMFNAHQHK